jgi:heme-degrading monooxygenase HmoA
MIARVWEGVVSQEKADGYGAYLAGSDRGVADYRRIAGNRGVLLLRRAEGDRVRFLLVSLWDSAAAIAAYAGPDIDRAQYFAYDRECLVDPVTTVAHYEVMVAAREGAPADGPAAGCAPAGGAAPRDHEPG